MLLHRQAVMSSQILLIPMRRKTISNFDQTIAFINKAKGACHFGNSRSVTIVIAYVMKEKECMAFSKSHEVCA